jgi:hypothetical protein
MYSYLQPRTSRTPHQMLQITLLNQAHASV